MELISLFLSNLPESATDEDAALALSLVNEEDLSRILPFETGLSQELIDLYDLARDYNIVWPQPLGTDTYKVVKKIKFYETDNMSGMS